MTIENASPQGPSTPTLFWLVRQAPRPLHNPDEPFIFERCDLIAAIKRMEIELANALPFQETVALLKQQLREATSERLRLVAISAQERMDAKKIEDLRLTNQTLQQVYNDVSTLSAFHLTCTLLTGPP